MASTRPSDWLPPGPPLIQAAGVVYRAAPSRAEAKGPKSQREIGSSTHGDGHVTSPESYLESTF